MKNFNSAKNKFQNYASRHNAERNRNAAYKLNAIILLGMGWKLKDVKKALLLSEEILRSYVDKYQSGGITELVETNYLGRQVDLDAKQLKCLHKELNNTIYLIASAIVQFVTDTFHITYSVSGMRDLLHREGYNFKKSKSKSKSKSKLVPGNPDIQAQEDFIHFYEAFMEAKGNDVEVIFIDAIHPEHNTMAGYGWIKKGEQRKLKTNSGRQRLNLHGAINAETMEMTLIESDTINRDSTGATIGNIGSKIFLC